MAALEQSQHLKSNETFMHSPAKLPNIAIRQATVSDAARISGLLRSLSHTYTISPDGAGAEPFLATLTETAIAAFILRADVFYLVAESATKDLVGAAAMQGNHTVAHLFVSPHYQGRGDGDGYDEDRKEHHYPRFKFEMISHSGSLQQTRHWHHITGVHNPMGQVDPHQPVPGE